MSIFDHGIWELYTPENSISGVLYFRSVLDQTDWYVYLKEEGTFDATTIKLVVENDKVIVANRDPTTLVPMNNRVLEVEDETSDPSTYVGKLYQNGTFVEDTFVPVPAAISDRQFFQQLAVLGIISQDDALASNAAVIPPPLLAIIDAMPTESQFGVKMLVSGATIFHRNHPVTEAIGAAYGWTSEQIDDFFRAAAQL